MRAINDFNGLRANEDGSGTLRLSFLYQRLEPKNFNGQSRNERGMLKRPIQPLFVLNPLPMARAHGDGRAAHIDDPEMLDADATFIGAVRPPLRESVTCLIKDWHSHEV